MPRDGSGVYTTYSGTDGITNQPILSTPYNRNVHDVEADLNSPRPIVAGGTGASNATQARANMQAERAMQVVTNFDSQPWETGSFSAAVGATGSPDGTGASTNVYAGTVEVIDGNNIVVEARNLTTGTMYMRKKVGGAWSGWTVDSGSGLSGQYVLKTGDTMTGPLVAPVKGNYFGVTGGTLATGAVTSSDANIKLYDFGGGNWGGIGTDTAGNMWFRSGLTGGVLPAMYIDTSQYLSIANSTPTAPNHVASKAYVDNVATGPGSNRVAKAGDTMSGALIVTPKGSTFGTNGGGTATSGVPATDANILLYNNTGTNWAGVGVDPAGIMWFRTGTSGSPVPALRISTDQTSTFTNSLYVLQAGTSVPLNTGSLGIGVNATGGQYGVVFKSNTDPFYPQIFMNSAGTGVGNISCTSTATTFNSGSDGRLKEDLKSFDAGRIVDDTMVYDFAWKSTGERSYGVIAQQANEVYPAAVTHDTISDWWGIDYSKYVPVLLQELKALRVRVSDLEGKLGVGVQPA